MGARLSGDGKGRAAMRRLRAEQTQRSAQRALRDELLELHYLSLEVMREKGLAPPLYGGQHLGERAECRLVYFTRQSAAEPPAIVVVAARDAEPNPDLALERDAVGCPGMVYGPLAHDTPTHTFPLASVDAPHGANVVQTRKHLYAQRPFAIFPLLAARKNAAGRGPGQAACRGLAICADSPAMLEAAVWDFRLALALERECQILREEGTDPASVLPALTLPDLVAYHEVLVMRATRLYGCTSPLRDQQARLDVLRDENGDLRVPLPLKPEIEPVMALARERRHTHTSGGELLYLPAAGTALATFWPQIRASRFFCIRQTLARLDRAAWRITGYADHPALDWLLADDLGRLYRLVHLYCLYECLAVAGLITPEAHPAEAFFDPVTAREEVLP